MTNIIPIGVEVTPDNQPNLFDDKNLAFYTYLSKEHTVTVTKVTSHNKDYTWIWSVRTRSFMGTVKDFNDPFLSLALEQAVRSLITTTDLLNLIINKERFQLIQLLCNPNIIPSSSMLKDMSTFIKAIQERG